MEEALRRTHLGRGRGTVRRHEVAQRSGPHLTDGQMAEDSEAPTPGFGQGAGLRRPCSSLEKAKARVEARTIVLLLEALAAVGGIEGGCGAAGGARWI